MSVSVEPSDLESGLQMSSWPSKLDLCRFIKQGCSGARRLSTSKQRLRGFCVAASGRRGVEVAVVVGMVGFRLVFRD